LLLLLPPSEGKARLRRGEPVDLAALSFPELRRHREAALDALVALCSGDPEAARTALGLSPGQAGDVALDAVLRGAAAAPAAKVYTGVLFERLGLAEVPKARRDRHVLIASALWGVLRPGDRIPAYRLSIGARLPGLPALAAHWRPALREALPDDGLVVDLRSGPYAAAWRPRHAQLLAVRAFTEAPDGRRTVVSHMAKAARGEVARALLLARGRAPRDAEAVLRVVTAAGLTAELAQDGRALDVIERPR
jgi:hypothetical protein